uniref:protein trichome birefringence-like 14 n=1 Tax=Erigeron canadensis TaxID=72917 RepID=UPI001CB8E7D0|nr:protein trichome birefringence-like 14 [Erigeron canadensis]XP_043629314.1 protein trichome birefringence-like 14 [Erigeron canadensis]
MMKGGGGGGYFYERRTKQLSLFFIGVVFTTILILWSWDKNPLLTTTFFPSHAQLLQLFPGEEAEVKQLKHSKDDLREAEGVAKSSPLSYVNTSSLDTIRDEGVVDFVSPLSSIKAPSLDLSSKNALEKLHENTTDIVGISISSGASEKQSDPKPPKQQLVEPMASSIPVPAEEKKGCSFGKGKWVTDESWPLYSGFGCKQWLSGMWACRLTQRTDFGYEKLKWQPKDCKMNNFTGPEFLKRMQDKTMAFIGDSLGRQQFQSLMCMITGGEERHDVQDVGKEYGLVKARGSVRPDGWAYRFPITNTTILYYWSASLCELDPIDPINGTTYFAMHLDRPPAFLQRYISRFNVVVLNTGHHWNRGKLNANRWVMYVGGKPNTNRKIAEIANAKNLTIYSIVKWVNGQLPKYPGLKAFYRSISPRHFFNGDWNSGGTCDSTAPGALEVLIDESSDSIASGAVKGTDVKLLDITALSQVRDEGHISRYSIRSTPGVQDCLHWCLPGIPDTWNELLFSQI